MSKRKLTLREARQRAKLTQDELAQRASVDQTHISGIECGRRGASPNIHIRLAAALGLDVTRLVIADKR